MGTNNNNQNSHRNYGNENNERHSNPNRSYNTEGRGNREGGNREGGNYQRSPQRDYQSSSSGQRKRRPRVGDRSSSGGSSYGGGYQQRSGERQGSYGGGERQGSYGGGERQGSYGRPRHPYGSQSGPNKTLKKKKPFKQIKYKENADPNAPIRLNKYMANAGVCSRREADEHIAAGLVKVNDVVITELGTKITRADEVKFNNKVVTLESKVYVLLNKPKGFVTTTDDPENRKTVMDLVRSACTERIYPVGRLDRGTTGVLLLTNDGDLASKLTHPKYEKRKIYQVWLDKPVAMEHMQAIADGIELEDGEIHADAISYVTEEDLSQVGIEIHSGRNRIVRRIFESLGYKVYKLDRVYFAGLTKKKLSRGKWRYLTEQEVNMLRMGAFD